RGVAWFAGWTRLIGNVTQTVIIVVGAWLVIEGWTQIGVLAAFILYLRRFYGPLDELVQFFNLYQSASAALEKIAAVLDTEPGVPAPKTPVHLPARAGTTASAGDGAGATASAGTAAATTGRSIEITDVRFAYADGPDVLPR
ncbi:ABC transporter ATP-binding protein, partial [Burkholderia multivorans]